MHQWYHGLFVKISYKYTCTYILDDDGGHNWRGHYRGKRGHRGQGNRRYEDEEHHNDRAGHRYQDYRHENEGYHNDRRGHNRGQGHTRFEDEGHISGRGGRGSRRPPGLRGRDIGMFFAQKSKAMPKVQQI